MMQKMKEAVRQLSETREIIEDWFGSDVLKPFKYISVFYTDDSADIYLGPQKDTYWIQGPDEVETKLDEIHTQLTGNELSQSNFDILANK